MPSITNAALNDLKADAANAWEARGREHDRAEVAEGRLRTYDTVLDKIVRVAHGVPLTDGRNSGNYYSQSYVSDGTPTRKLKVEERQENEIRNLNERITTLEARLAAVVAVATFAKDHKA